VGEDRSRRPTEGAVLIERHAGSSPAFFGRRVGKKLRPHQSDLMRTFLPELSVDPRAAIIDPATLFGRPMRETRLEIGFGGGEHLIAQARAHPDVGFIGCEAFVNGVAKILAEIETQKLDNIRLHAADALTLLPRLPDASIATLYVLYPDPWPKPRQRKRRIVSDETLLTFARILKPGGDFRFATDIDDYSAWTLARVLRSPAFVWDARRAADWTTPWAGWESTRYEKKAFREGRTPAYLTFRRV
jgi:tRNA (guanine-N7-)-methyltransferase